MGVCVFLSVFDWVSPFQTGGGGDWFRFSVSVTTCLGPISVQFVNSHKKILRENTDFSVCIDPESVSDMRLPLGWKPEEVWFAVCHHPSCLIPARAPSKSHPNINFLVCLID